MKAYILGMAKSPLQVTKGQYNGIADAFCKSPNPGPLRNLELDFLRLVYVTKELLEEGFKVHAYLMVATPEVEEKVKKWKNKYKVENDIVNIVCASLNENEILRLVEEKQKIEMQIPQMRKTKNHMHERRQEKDYLKVN